MIFRADYVVAIGGSRNPAHAWRRDHPDRPFVGVLVDDGEVWVAFEPKVASGSLSSVAVEKIRRVFEKTSGDTWTDDEVFLCGVRTLREGHRLARAVIGVLRSHAGPQGAS